MIVALHTTWPGLVLIVIAVVAAIGYVRVSRA